MSDPCGLGIVIRFDPSSMYSWFLALNVPVAPARRRARMSSGRAIGPNGGNYATSCRKTFRSIPHFGGTGKW